MAKSLQSEHFSLKWNNFSNNLTSGFLSHLIENYLVDVTLAVEGQLIQAHKLVLSVCSPYFKNIFKENPCQHPVIILKDVKHAEVEALLNFMYQGEVSMKQEDLSTFLKVAQTLQIKGLAEENYSPLLSHDIEKELNVYCKSEIEDIEVWQDITEKCEAKTINKPKRCQDTYKKYIKKKRRIKSSPAGSLYDSNKSTEIPEAKDIIFLSNEDSHDSSSSEEKSLDITENNKANQKEQSFNSQILKEDPINTAVQPVTYRLSARGRPQLVHEGYVYNLTSRSEGLNRSHYRCAEQHRGCRGKCAVIAERFMPTGVHDHNHPPGYQSECNYKTKRNSDTDSI